jgi:hypothetical protein
MILSTVRTVKGKGKANQNLFRLPCHCCWTILAKFKYVYLFPCLKSKLNCSWICISEWNLMAIIHGLFFLWCNNMWHTLLYVVLLVFFCPNYSFLIFSCQGGVQRVHIVDGTVGGSLLLELFTRDGVGTMIARYNRTVFSMLAANEHSSLGV